MNHTPPTTVASAARRGLRLAARAGVTDTAAIKCGTRLAERKPHSLADVSKLFARHSLSATHKPANVGSDATPSKWLAESLLMGGQAGHDWAASVVRRAGAGESAAALGLARRGEAQMWTREAPPTPATALVHNPNGLHMGRAFRVLTAGQTVRDGNDGATLGNFDEPTLAEFVRVFEARCRAGEGAPRIDYNHGPSRGMDPTLFGAVVACYVADDGERGPGLYVVPGWTDYGRDFIAKHATPDGGSVLSNSPEFRVGPAYARGGGSPDEQGALLGGAELLGVAITGSPQQSEAIIDPIRLSRAGADTAYAAEEVSNMDPEQEAASGGDERVAALEAAVAQIGEQQAKFGQLLAAISAKLDGDGEAIVAEASEAAMSAVEDVTAEAVEEVRAAAEQQMAALEPEEVTEVDEAMGEELKALSRRGVTNARRQKAWARRGELARSIMSQRQVKALSREVETLKARALDAECDAEMVRLRGIGMAPADEEYARAQWHDKQRNGQAWSKANPKTLHAFDRFVGDLKRAPRVPMGVRGVTGENAGGGVTRADIRAWAKDNGHDYDQDPSRAGAAWAKATGRSTQEITR